MSVQPTMPACPWCRSTDFVEHYHEQPRQAYICRRRSCSCAWVLTGAAIPPANTVPVERVPLPAAFADKAQLLLMSAFDLLESDAACGCGWVFHLGDYADEWQQWKMEKAHMANGGVCPNPSDTAKLCVDIARLLEMPKESYRHLLVAAGESTEAK